jgi:hypothetical protein
MTEQHMARRTLVKSPPELWAQCSDAASLARHLGQFGEIRITRLEPETTVAWEGEDASGTVRLEPSGWGTQVTLTAETAVEVVEAEPVVEAEVEEAEVAVEEPEVAAVVAEEEPEPEPEEEPEREEERKREEEREPEVGAAPRASFFARLRLLFRVPPREELVAVKEDEADDAELAVAEPEPEPEPEHEPVAVAAEPEVVEAEPEPEPVTVQPDAADTTATTAALRAALDSLGQAHHRPFSRA